MTGRPQDNGRGKRLVFGYEAIRDDLRAEIKKGTYAVGDQIPTKQDLMKQYGASLNTVTHAITDLKDEGLVEPRQGRGTYVTKPPSRKPRPGYETMAKAMGVMSEMLEDMSRRLEVLEAERDDRKIRTLADEPEEPEEK